MIANLVRNIMVYLNFKQIQFLEATQRIKFALCGRAFGKSFLIGEHNIDKMKNLPGAKSALVGLTYKHIKTKTVLPMIRAWRENWGMEEYDDSTGTGDYVLYKKPPLSWRKNMLAPPGDWDNIISFPNGYHIELVSAVSLDYARGASYDAMDIDEAGFCLTEEEYDEILSPTLRGNLYIYNHPLHQSVCFFTSIPWLPSGNWIYKFEQLAKEQPDKYYWVEGNAYDNVVVLGKDWIENQRDVLGELRFQVEILNKRISKLPNGFYYAFDERRNSFSLKDLKKYYYSKGLSSEIENIFDLMQSGNYEALWAVLSAYGATDYCLNPNIPIDVSFDFNAALNTMLVAQHNKDNNKFIFYEELFVKYESYLENVVAFCKMFENNPCKVVNIYGDRNGNKRDANNVATFFEKIIEQFKKCGWECNHISTGGVEQSHHLRYDSVNTLYEGKDGLPTILYMPSCSLTIHSILTTPTKAGKHGFEKDKRSEVQLTGTDRREYATDWGDNSDYLLVDKFGFNLGVARESLPIEF